MQPSRLSSKTLMERPRPTLRAASLGGLSSETEAKTQAGQAYQIIRADILACRLRPGAKIKINELCDSLGVSLGSIREALSRLGAEGWVIAQPQKGYRVTPISGEDLINLTKARIEVETLCLRSSMEQGDIKWESRILATFHALRYLPERNEDDQARIDDEWSYKHADFHEAIVSACTNPWLLRMRGMLFAQSERYRQLSVPLRNWDRDVDQEHHEITKALLARNVNDASMLIARHFETTMSIIVESLRESSPDG